MKIGMKSMDNRDEVGAASVDYLMYSGYVMMAYYWALQADKADELLRNSKGRETAEFYRAKIQTAEFYFERLLPRASTHKTCALAPTDSVMQMDKENFAFD